MVAWRVALACVPLSWWLVVVGGGGGCGATLLLYLTPPSPFLSLCSDFEQAFWAAIFSVKMTTLAF